MPKKYFSDNKGMSFTVKEIKEKNEEWIKIPKIVYNEFSRVIPEWVILFPKPINHECF